MPLNGVIVADLAKLHSSNEAAVGKIFSGFTDYAKDVCTFETT